MQQQVLRSFGRETIRHTRFLRVWHDGALPGTVAHLRCANLPHFEPSTDRRPTISVAVLANSTPTTDRAGQRLAGIVEGIVANPPTSWPIDQPLQGSASPQ
jgi:hypothetical protein